MLCLIDALEKNLDVKAKSYRPKSLRMIFTLNNWCARVRVPSDAHVCGFVFVHVCVCVCACAGPVYVEQQTLDISKSVLEFTRVIVKRMRSHI